MIRSLPRLIPAGPGKPVRDGVPETQALTRALAHDPASWSPADANETVTRYTELASIWNESRGGYRSVPLADALTRGGPFPGGTCLEVGCGTGLLTPLLLPVWTNVLCVDLTWQMLSQAGAGWRVLADASRLPVRDASAAAMVFADVPLFTDEVIRVLADDGVLVWSTALGTDAPHYIPVEEIAAALGNRSPGSRWTAVTARAGWGVWAVLRRQRTGR